MSKDLIAALKAATPTSGGQSLLLDTLYGDDPDVLEAVRTARANGVSCRSIAELISSDGRRVSENAVRNWLRSQGIE